MASDEPAKHGMQEVRGSNPLSSTYFQLKNNSILKMIFDLLHARQEGQGLNSLSFTFPQVSSTLRSWKNGLYLLEPCKHTPWVLASCTGVLQLSPMLRVPAGRESPKRSVPGSKTGAKPGTTGYTAARLLLQPVQVQ